MVIGHPPRYHFKPGYFRVVYRGPVWARFILSNIAELVLFARRIMVSNVNIEDLRSLVNKEVTAYPSESGANPWWRNPLLVTATADERFDCLSNIAAKEHVLPKDLLASAKTVIVFFLPFVKALQEENSQGKFPCRSWGVAYEQTNALITHLSEQIRGFLSEHGYASALTPATHNFDPIKLMSKWSHKHLAHIAGLGRFGVNCQLITPSRCAGRLGSLVTEADLGNHPLVKVRELCLHKKGEPCLECLERCPVQALNEEGIDRMRCYARLQFNLNRIEALSGLQGTTHVCGKCVVDLPCSMDPLIT